MSAYAVGESGPLLLQALGHIGLGSLLVQPTSSRQARFFLP